MLTTLRATVLSAGLLAPLTCGPNWRDLRPGSAGFLVTLPNPAVCDPTHRSETSRGTLRGGDCLANSDSGERFSVHWLHLPEGLDAGEVEALIHELGARVTPTDRPVRRQAADLGGAPGIELEWSYGVLPNGNPYVSRRREAVHAGRLYRLEYLGERTNATDAMWTRVVESFRHLPGPNGEVVP